jgi:hypothetical protein
LVEVMVVVAIVGVLAALSFIGISDVLGRARLLADADTIDDTLRRGRLVARMERRCVEVVASRSRLDGVPVQHPGAPPGTCVGGRLLTDRNIGKAFSSGISLGEARFFFDRAGGVVVPGGSTRIGGGIDLPVTVRPTNALPRTFVVRILAGTGAISRLP